MKRTERGFTLIELMIVMVLMAILASIVIGNFATSSKRGRDSRRKSDLQNVQTALESYFNDKGVYPSAVSGVMTGCGTADAQPCSWGGQFADQHGTIYMAVIPEDPIESQQYYYASNTTSYVLYAHLENPLDTGTGVKQSGYTDKFTAGQTNCASGGVPVACTFAIGSSNVSP